MNNPTYFQQLTLDSKAEYVHTHGTYLVSRVEDDCIYSLYALKNFFAEFQYSIAENKLIVLSDFSDILFLEPYLNVISLAQLSKFVRD